MQILLAEDDAITSAKLEQLLDKWGYETIHVTDGEAAWDVLQQDDGPRLALLDWMMPIADGIQVCRRIRAATDLHYIYTVLLTQKSGRGDLVAGLTAGADDYLVKPVHPAELYARLRSGERVLKVQAELMRMREVLERQALHDPVSNTLNRRAGMLALERAMARASREEQAITVVMCDLDNFKAINDTWGHSAGDLVIETVCRRMADALRPYDALSRHGGEEFLIVLPGVTEVEAKGIVERCRACIADAPVKTGGHEISVTCSFGVCVAKSVKDLVPDDLLAAADAALYRAKDAGRDHVEIAHCQPRTDDATA